MLVEVATPTNTASLTLNQKVLPTKAEGKTKLVLVKFNKKVDNQPSGLPQNKCALTDADTTGFSCSFKTVTVSDQNDYTKATIGNTATNFADASQTTFLALVTTDPKNIKDFDGHKLIYHKSSTPSNTKFTFDIIGLIGGDDADNKTTYFLETTPKKT